MTYVVGLKRGGDAVLVADSAVTGLRTERSVINAGLKTGQLFPGCLYGLVGAAEAARQFVLDCKKALTGRNSLLGRWSGFEAFTKNYDYPWGRDFSALLCVRSFGDPRLFTFSPRSGLSEHNELVTLGSGSALLDDNLRRFLHDIGYQLVDKFASEGIRPGLSAGAAVSLWLTQQTQGDEVSILEDQGVGGVFHFSLQTRDEEKRQPPGVFLLTRKDQSGSAAYWFYRVAFVRAALVVHCGSDRTIRTSLDEAVWPRSAALSADEMRQYFDDVDNEAHAQPVYEFWGMGVADSLARNALFLSFGRGDEIDWNGNIGPFAQEVIRRTLDLHEDKVVLPIEWRDRVLLPRTSTT